MKKADGCFADLPVFAICGYSGAGKTTLILVLIARLHARGLSALVLKHDVHGLLIDGEGKDTDRFFRAGAGVWARDDRQTLVRMREDAGELKHLVARLAARYDVILIEGYKAIPVQNKVWLRRCPSDVAPSLAKPVALDLGRDEDRCALAWNWIAAELQRIHEQQPTFAGILLGGRSSRMGSPKQLLVSHGKTWLARVESAVAPLVDRVVLLGDGPVPRSSVCLGRLPDAPGRAGPPAGMCAAMRWHPDARWLFLPCDVPLITSEALRWLAGQARPGIWAVQPRLTERARSEPLPGWYDWRAAVLLESAAGPSALSHHPRTYSPVIPGEFVRAFVGCNTPEERRRLLGN